MQKCSRCRFECSDDSAPLYFYAGVRWCKRCYRRRELCRRIARTTIDVTSLPWAVIQQACRDAVNPEDAELRLEAWRFLFEPNRDFDFWLSAAFESNQHRGSRFARNFVEGTVGSRDRTEDVKCKSA